MSKSKKALLSESLAKHIAPVRRIAPSPAEIDAILDPYAAGEVAPEPSAPIPFPEVVIEGDTISDRVLNPDPVQFSNQVRHSDPALTSKQVLDSDRLHIAQPDTKQDPHLDSYPVSYPAQVGIQDQARIPDPDSYTTLALLSAQVFDSGQAQKPYPDSHTTQEQTSGQVAKTDRGAQSDPVRVSGGAKSELKKAPKGYFSLPNHLFDEVLPQLLPREEKPFLQLIRLSHGWHRTWCNIAMPKLADRAGLAESTTRLGVQGLASKGLIRMPAVINTGKEDGGITFEVFLRMGEAFSAPPLETVPGTNSRPGTVSRPMKIHDDDLSKTDHHQSAPVEIFRELTGNAWRRADDDSFTKLFAEHQLSGQPLEAMMRSIAASASEPIEFFAYFAKSIRKRLARKGKELRKGYENIFAQMRRSGTYAGASASSFEEAFRRHCDWEKLHFDKQLFNEMLAQTARGQR
jgi:hypothetical protein